MLRFSILAMLALGARSVAAQPCMSSYDCDAPAAPYCNPATDVCDVGLAACAGDDAADNGISDDGPATATAVALPATITGSICHATWPQHESDFVTFEVTREQDIAIRIDPDDVALSLYSAELEHFSRCQEVPGDGCTYRIPAGRYFLEIYSRPESPTATRPYTLAIDPIECTTPLDCTDPARPQCGSDLTCVSGPADCAGDDARDAGGGDDGVAGATLVASGTTLAGAVCNVPFDRQRRFHYGIHSPDRDVDEADWFAIDVEAGEGLEAVLEFDEQEDLDLLVIDASGEVFGRSHWVDPERVTLTYLPEGRYFLRVVNATWELSSAAKPYTLSVARTEARTCVTTEDCAQEFATQHLRPTCADGVCHFAGPVGYSFAANAHRFLELARCDSRGCAEGFTCKGYLPPGQSTPGCLPGSCSEAVLGSCVPHCECDAECGADITKDPAGQLWFYRQCNRSTGVCTLEPEPGLVECVAESPADGGCSSSRSGALGPLVVLLLGLLGRRSSRTS